MPSIRVLGHAFRAWRRNRMWAKHEPETPYLADLLSGSPVCLHVGASDGRIITRHILPNVMSHVIVAITLGIPSIVLLESFLGFLGFAVKPPLISWGLMLQDAGTFSVIGSYPWILSPVGFVLVTVFAFNALGDGLRDAIDPY